MTTFLWGVLFMGLGIFGIVQYARTPVDEPKAKDFSSDSRYRQAVSMWARRPILPYMAGAMWLFGLMFVVAAFAYR